LEDGDNKIYAGIKMEVVSSSEKGIISVSIDSMKRRAISRVFYAQCILKGPPKYR
jgi:hypothetical protein